MIINKWSVFKSIVDSKSLSIQFIEHKHKYTMAIVDGTLLIEYTMAKGVNPSEDQSDFETNYKSIGNRESGVIKTIIKMATVNWNTHTFSSFKIDYVCIRNDGTEDVAIAWNTDDKDGTPNPEYRTLKPGETTPTFGITKDTEMHYKRLTGTGGHRLEITAWG